jgi:fructose-1,6-bisphosphatase II
MTDHELSPNLGLDLVRSTEAAAIAAGRWMGLGRSEEAETVASRVMLTELNLLPIDGRVAMGEEGRPSRRAPLITGQLIGLGIGPQIDIVADPIDGRNQLA